jgi:hypothetical protein
MSKAANPIDDATKARSNGATASGAKALRARWLRGEKGQALAEQGILLATLLGGLAVGGVWMMKTHPQMLNAINIQVRGYYFVLSLPFP